MNFRYLLLKEEKLMIILAPFYLLAFLYGMLFLALGVNCVIPLEYLVPIAQGLSISTNFYIAYKVLKYFTTDKT